MLLPRIGILPDRKIVTQDTALRYSKSSLLWVLAFFVSICPMTRLTCFCFKILTHSTVSRTTVSSVVLLCLFPWPDTSAYLDFRLGSPAPFLVRYCHCHMTELASTSYIKLPSM